MSFRLAEELFMSMNADQIAEYQVFAEQLAEAAALAI